jgi:DNA-binding NtrC family response regulator
MSMGLRKGPIVPISQTNGRYKSPVKNREVQLSSAGSHDCRGGVDPLDLLRMLRSRAADLPVILLVRESDGEAAVAAFKLGA